MKVAKAKNSAVLASNAVHHRVDSLTALAALVSIAASNMFPSLVALDAIAAMVISGMVIRAGTTNVWTSFTELADQAISSDAQKSKVQKAVEEAADSISADTKLEISAVRGLKSGQNYLWEVKLIAPDTATVLQLGEWEAEIRRVVAAKVRGTRIVKVRWVAEGAVDREEVFGEWVPEKEGKESAPVENGHENGHAHTHGEAEGKKAR
jgi:divalent metal cation (Fe/Co/Zn/Cd) transporter